MSVAQVKRIAISDSPIPWLLPLVCLLVVFTIYPLIYNVWLSFHEFVPTKRALKFVGMANWVQLWNDTRFWSALGVTFLYFIVALVFEIILGMAIAMLLDAELPGFSVLRATLSMTLVIPPPSPV
ncbi:hypothetical protein LZK77_32375 (plasmid) [Rhizobium leguminosarum]|nr:hypothetical protein LZK77_32375 [Rhizobium leguminosarum]UIK01798.1 hypothetical protein LZK82_32405 [Rhizobium leguminosarum]UIK14684.1 hypothetical protein LZK80_38115 [Rhizobium leguminosarum]UIL31594.1 hypothetical protein LZK75_38370 [Rhizobium leguminosarum]